ncbi:hypothetical protein, partial [Paenibacillus alba]|uniref:hypothetical protein n=1 Tax=Paenibacillus alba TaxID=1197127 RepID=UPI001C202EC4
TPEGTSFLYFAKNRAKWTARGTLFLYFTVSPPKWADSREIVDRSSARTLTSADLSYIADHSSS